MKNSFESQPQQKNPEKLMSHVTAIIYKELKKAGKEGIAYDQLLDILQGHGLVDVEVGEEIVSTKVSSWDETPEYEHEVKPVFESRSVYDTDDVNTVVGELNDLKLARFDRDTKKFYLLGE